MAYINTETNQYPLSEMDIRLANPNTSYPAQFVPGEPYAWVFPSPMPTHDPIVQRVIELAPNLVEGNWYQQWQVIPKFQEYTDENNIVHTVEEQEADAVTTHLTNVQNQIWGQIKQIRDKKLQLGGFHVADKWFHSDTFSRSQFLALARKADKVESQGGNMDTPFNEPGTTNPLYWKTMDGSFVAVTPAIAKAVVDAAELQDAQLFKRAEVLKATVNANPNPYSVDITVGWPATYNNV